MEPPLVSITLLTHNNPDLVRETLGQILETDYPNYEIIAVDNDSTDDVIGMIEREFPLVRVVRQSVNNPLRARNTSFEHAHGDFVVLLDDDSYPEPHAITRMVERFQKDPCLGMIAFHIPCGDYFTTALWEEWGASNAGHFLACGAGIRRRVWEEIRYYCDEVLESYNDEYDFTYRALAAGYTLGHFKDIVAHHKTKTNSARLPNFFYRNRRNDLYLIGKYFPVRYWTTIYIWSLCYSVLQNYNRGGGGLLGVRAVFWGLLGHFCGIWYMFKGFDKRVKLPRTVLLYSLCRRGYGHVGEWLFDKDARKRLWVFAKEKNKTHNFCPQKIEHTRELRKRLLRPPRSCAEEQFFDIERRFLITRCRKKEDLKEIDRALLADYKSFDAQFDRNTIFLHKYLRRLQILEYHLSKKTKLIP